MDNLNDTENIVEMVAKERSETMSTMDAMNVKTNCDIIPLDKLKEAREKSDEERAKRHEEIMKDMLIRGKEHVLEEIGFGIQEMIDKRKNYAIVDVVNYDNMRYDYFIDYSWKDVIKLVGMGSIKISKLKLMENLVFNGFGRKSVQNASMDSSYIGNELARYAESVMVSYGYKYSKLVMPELELYKYYIHTGESGVGLKCFIFNIFRSLGCFLKYIAAIFIATGIVTFIVIFLLSRIIG